MNTCPHFLKTGSILFILYIQICLPQGIAQTRFTWAAQTGNWQIAANWAPTGVPGANDTAVVNNGIVTATTPVSVSGLELGDAEINGAKLTILSMFRWNNGRLSGSGSADSTILGNDAKMIIDGTSQRELVARTLMLRGDSRFSSNGDIRLGNGATLVNNTNRLFEWHGDGDIGTLDGSGKLINLGTIERDNSASTNLINVLFEHRGTLINNSGELRIIAGSDQRNATLQIAENAVLRMSSTGHLLNDVSVSGDGEFRVQDAEIELTGNGLRIENGTTMRIATSGSRISGSGALENFGSIEWLRGTISGDGEFVNHSQIRFSGESATNLEFRTLSNNGSIEWLDNTDLRLGDNAKIINNLSGTIEIVESANIFFREPDGGSIVNNGLLIKSGTSATDESLIDATFENSGELQISGGTLRLNRDSDYLSGNLAIAESGILEISGGNHIFSDAFSALLAGELHLSDGSIFSESAFSGNGKLTIDGGIFTFLQSFSLDQLILNNGILNGSGNLRVDGLMRWRRGTLQHISVTANGDLEMNGGTSDIKFIDAATLTNAGEGIWSGEGDIRIANGGVLFNQDGGTLLFSATGDILKFFGNTVGGRVHNNGQLRQTGVVTDVLLEIALENNGTLAIESGTMNVADGSSGTSAEIFVAQGSSLTFSGGLHEWENMQLSGAGTIILNRADVLLTGSNGLVVNAPLRLDIRNSESKLRGNSPIFNKGMINWERGEISGSGTIDNLGELNFTGEGFRTINSRNIRNFNIINWFDGGKLRMQNGATLYNLPGGTLNLHPTTALTKGLSDGGKVLNTGLLRKLPGSHIAMRADVENSGSIDISDTLIFEQSLTNHPTGNIRGNGFLDVSAANFVNNGTLAPGNSPGILSVIGNYPLSDAADVAIELGGKTPGSEHDQLRISGAAYLTGSRLHLSLLNRFVPANGDTLEILQTAGRNGTFSTFSGIDTAYYDVQYLPDAVRLVNFNFPVNTQPVAQNDAFDTGEDVSIQLDVLANDSDADGDSLQFDSFSQPKNGTVSLMRQPFLYYKPANDFFGLDTFQYSIIDGVGGVDTAQVVVQVHPVNDAPQISPALPDVAFPADSGATLALAEFATDIDHSTGDLQWQAQVLAVILPSAKVDTSDLHITIDPLSQMAQFSVTADSTGAFAVEFRVSDPDGASARDTIFVFALSKAPTLLFPVEDIVLIEDSSPFTAVKNLNEMFVDPDGDVLRFRAISGAGIAAEISGDSLVITPEPDYFGARIITVRAVDPSGASASDLFSVTVTAVEDPPNIAAFPGFIQFPRDTFVTINVWDFAEDPDMPDSLLAFTFEATNDSLLRDFHPQTGMLTLASIGNFSGDVNMTVTATDTAGNSDSKSVLVRIDAVTGIDDVQNSGVPAQFTLSQNYPNPFNPVTRIRYDLPKSAQVQLSVFNILGERVAVLVNQKQLSGRYEVAFDGSQLSSGLYFYRIVAGNFREVRKMLLIR